MIGRSRIVDRLQDALFVILQLWPLIIVWWAWHVADDQWQAYLLTFPANRGGSITTGYEVAVYAWPTVALLGPALIMTAAIMLHRMNAGRRMMALAGVFCMIAAAVFLAGWSVYRLLWPYVVDQGYSPLTAYDLLDLGQQETVWTHATAVAIGLVGAYVGFCIATQVRPAGTTSALSLQRGTSDNFGHADWLSMKAARQRFPGPDPAYGGIVVGEAYRVDQDRTARATLFDPKDPRTWGNGGRAPLLIDPCHVGSTHALVFAGSGGFKTTAVAIPTLLTWTGSAVVLDPSCEIAPMMQAYREQTLGHRVVVLDPFRPGAGVNVLDWIDPADPKAEMHVDTVVRWLCGETRNDSGDRFFSGRGRNLIRCLLADMIWDPDLTPRQKTLRTLRRRIVTPEDEMRDLLDDIHRTSLSPKARDLAGTIKSAFTETFSGIYQNADEDTAWLSTSTFADLVSGSSLKTTELAGGNLTVFVQIPLSALRDTPAVGRVVIGALLNAIYEANSAVAGRTLFLLDEVASLGYMKVLETARDAGRKYGITLLMLYQSLGQLTGHWGREGRQAWFDGTAWQLFAAIQDWDTARHVSEMCGEYGVVATSAGDSSSSQTGHAGPSSSTGRSENRSETKRPLIKPEELMHDCRWDEAVVLAGGIRPLRLGRAIYFRRPEWNRLVGSNRFHRKRADAG